MTETTIQAFFYAIEQKEPESVLDIGMFLRKIGSISREFGDKTIGDKVRLCGVDHGDETLFPVYRALYDDILDYPQFLDDDKDASEHYDLALYLGMAQEQKSVPDERLLDWLRTRTDYLFTEYNDDAGMEKLGRYGTVTGITLDGEGYLVVKMRPETTDAK